MLMVLYIALITRQSMTAFWGQGDDMPAGVIESLNSRQISLTKG